jgi:hypothetical protein
MSSGHPTWAILLLTGTVLLFVSNGLAAENSGLPTLRKSDDEMARSVTAGCQAILKREHADKTFDLGLCLGVIKGLHYLSGDVCVPPALSLRDVADVVSKYLDGHPNQIDEDFREVSLAAMRAAWPCAGRRNI